MLVRDTGGLPARQAHGVRTVDVWVHANGCRVLLESAAPVDRAGAVHHQVLSRQLALVWVPDVHLTLVSDLVVFGFLVRADVVGFGRGSYFAVVVEVGADALAFVFMFFKELDVSRVAIVLVSRHVVIDIILWRIKGLQLLPLQWRMYGSDTWELGYALLEVGLELRYRSVVDIRNLRN